MIEFILAVFARDSFPIELFQDYGFSLFLKFVKLGHDQLLRIEAAARSKDFPRKIAGIKVFQAAVDSTRATATLYSRKFSGRIPACVARRSRAVSSSFRSIGRVAVYRPRIICKAEGTFNCGIGRGALT